MSGRQDTWKVKAVDAMSTEGTHMWIRSRRGRARTGVGVRKRANARVEAWL